MFCIGQPLFTLKVETALIEDAVTYLDKRCISITCKSNSDLCKLRNYKFSDVNHYSIKEGRALSYFRDSEWGDQVYRYIMGFDDHLHEQIVTAASVLIDKVWHSDISWITCIPSSCSPDRVTRFATELATKLQLEFRPSVKLVDGKKQSQFNLKNNMQKCRNVDGMFHINEHEVIRGSVLLVDDSFGSGWTMSVVANLMCETFRKMDDRNASCIPYSVFPFVLTGSWTS
jgi:hypothetical protein